LWVALREKGDLQAAAAEFQRASTIDPSSPVATQELKRTIEQMNELAHKQDEMASGTEDVEGNELASAPPELKPLPNTPVSLKMVNDVKIIFDTIGKILGVTVTLRPRLPRAAHQRGLE
jgi:general secretion pathway protein D